MGRSHWTAEILFGHSGKPLHYTGEITTRSLRKILTSEEYDDLDSINTVLGVAAVSLCSSVLKLVVGSAADWSATGHTDIDLLASLEERMSRVKFALRVGILLRQLPGVLVDEQNKDSKTFGYRKYFVHMASGTIFDLSFVGTDSWENNEVVEFHRGFNLAYCEL